MTRALRTFSHAILGHSVAKVPDRMLTNGGQVTRDRVLTVPRTVLKGRSEVYSFGVAYTVG